jgi:hypothetical protein
LERSQYNESAINIYYLIADGAPGSKDHEAALLRLARLAETEYADREQAKSFYAEMIEIFPGGAMADEAKRNLTRLSATRV